MIHLPTTATCLAAFATATALLLGGCSKPPATGGPPTPPAAESSAPPDSLGRIGDEATNLVNLWVEILAAVETEESADTASERLEAIADQFDSLVDRASQLPKLDATEFKRIDSRIDAQLGQAAAGLEHQRSRIFALPDAIKSRILPAHEEVLQRFRAMGRSMLNLREMPPTNGQVPDTQKNDQDDEREKAPE